MRILISGAGIAGPTLGQKNRIKSVRQSAKRMKTPNVLTPEEITALLKKLPEPLRTAVEPGAFTVVRCCLLDLALSDGYSPRHRSGIVENKRFGAAH